MTKVAERLSLDAPNACLPLEPLRFE